MHLTETQLNDLVDDVLADDERATVTAHLDVCAQCRAELAALRTLLQQVGQLPASVPPERDLRSDIWSQVDRKTLWHWRYPLAAAAVLLIAVTSVLTVLLTRESSGPVIRATQPAATTVDLVRLEQRYSSEVEQLQAVLRQNRDQLAPETVQILEENLQIIDAAILEARTALANDPQSAMLGELLRSAYQRKVDLLKQVARSSAET
jgi:anti-sigma factor RsiW